MADEDFQDFINTVAKVFTLMERLFSVHLADSQLIM